jgi:selT/selW/selH-like putative selenoprotein
LAAELNQEFGFESELVQLSGGIFNVYQDGKLVFSKHETGRFPEPGEIVTLLRKLATRKR